MPLDEIAEKVLKELNEYTLGDEDLGKVLEPLIRKCAKMSKNADEFRQCISESIATLKSAVSKVK
jgi:hypothetical protein